MKLYDMFFAQNKKNTFNNINIKVDDFRQELLSYYMLQDNSQFNELYMYTINLNYINHTPEYKLSDWTDDMINFNVITKSKLATLIMLGDYMNQYFKTKNPIDWFKLMKQDFNENLLDNWIEETFQKCIKINDNDTMNTIKKFITKNDCNKLGYHVPIND
jgi:hypothetical protein